MVNKNATETIAGLWGFTANSTALTQTAGNNSTRIATTAYVENVAPDPMQSVPKEEWEGVWASTTLQDDDSLVASLTASHTYQFKLMLRYQAQTTPDLKFKWAVPTGTTMIWGYEGSEQAGYTESTTHVISGSGSPIKTVSFIGIVFCDTTAGDMQLTWAQNVSHGSNSVITSGSLLKLRDITW